MCRYLLILHNIGGRDVRVRTLEASFRRDGEKVFTLPVKTYLQADTNSEFLFIPVTLKPGQEWTHAATFFNEFDRSEDKNYRTMESALQTNIHSKIRASAKQDDFMEADDVYVSPLREFFEERFSWLPGEYEMTIKTVDCTGK